MRKRAEVNNSHFSCMKMMADRGSAYMLTFADNAVHFERDVRQREGEMAALACNNHHLLEVKTLMKNVKQLYLFRQHFLEAELLRCVDEKVF